MYLMGFVKLQFQKLMDRFWASQNDIDPYLNSGTIAGMNFDGFYLVDKQKDWTSFDVCARMRKMLNTRKVGHTGTLDPFATGLLIVAVGKCTRLIPFLEKDKKTYRAKFLLGKTSETLDPESEICDVESPSSSPLWKGGGNPEKELEIIKRVIEEKFTGKISQVPPKFSAIKIGGKKCCDLARRGEKVEIKARETEVHNIKVLNYSYPELELEMTVSAGFYVRSLARDLGQELVGGGICTELRRTRIEDISVEDAELVENISTPIDPAFILKLEQREIPTGRVQDFISGRAFPMSGVEGEKVLVMVGGKSLGVGAFVAGNLQPRIVL